MAENGRVAGDPLAGGTYSQLLFSDHDDDDDVVGLGHFADQKPPKMLCFGDSNKNGCDLRSFGNEPTRISVQKYVVTCSDSSSASTNNINSLPKPINRKRNGCVNVDVAQGLSTGAAAPARSKKMKPENLSVTGHAKVKKEKLGERVAALQQLVSPFGKTDTASVLHEAMGYIKFLQEQVQVLCSPYLQRLPSSSHLHLHLHEGEEKGEGELRMDLRSRGLCLVPVDFTLHVAQSNGADFWSPAMVNNASSSQR